MKSLLAIDFWDRLIPWACSQQPGRHPGRPDCHLARGPAEVLWLTTVFEACLWLWWEPWRPEKTWEDLRRPEKTWSNEDQSFAKFQQSCGKVCEVTTWPLWNAPVVISTLCVRPQNTSYHQWFSRVPFTLSGRVPPCSRAHFRGLSLVQQWQGPKKVTQWQQWHNPSSWWTVTVANNRTGADSAVSLRCCTPFPEGEGDTHKDMTENSLTSQIEKRYISLPGETDPNRLTVRIVKIMCEKSHISVVKLREVLGSLEQQLEELRLELGAWKWGWGGNWNDKTWNLISLLIRQGQTT